MRLRTFTAPTMPDAIALVRKHLGADAIILSTRRAGGAVAVTAALDQAALDQAAEAAAAAGSRPPPDDPAETVEEALDAHGAPAALAESILSAAIEIDAPDPILALAGGLDAVFSFAPLTARPARRPLMLVGPPGAGKTIAVAKLATRAVIDGHRPRVISSDTLRAGGIAQLEAFTRLLRIDLHRADSTAQMTALSQAARGETVVLIDSGGINPYSATDRSELAALLAAAGAEPVFVLPAGGDVYDAVEMGQAFRSLGAARLLVTRLDMVHRLGSLLAAAHANEFSFCDAGLSPDVAEGLVPLNPVALARLLLPRSAAAGETSSLEPPP